MCVFKMPRFFLADVLFSDFLNFNKKNYSLSYTRFTYWFIYLFIYLRYTLCVTFLIIIVPPEMVAQKIKTMNDNKSPGVDEIHPIRELQTNEFSVSDL